MKVLCDTNTFIHYFNGNTETERVFQAIGFANILMPSVAAMELFRGMSNKEQLAKMKRRVLDYNILHIDKATSQKALEFIETYRLSHDLRMPDALIGAMSIVYQIPLFTYNTKDFKYLPGILLYK